jgi:hypothetical protein
MIVTIYDTSTYPPTHVSTAADSSSSTVATAAGTQTLAILPDATSSPQYDFTSNVIVSPAIDTVPQTTVTAMPESTKVVKAVDFFGDPNVM